MEESLRRGAIEQPIDDLFAGLRIRCSRKSRERYAKRTAQGTDPQVVGPKIMAPLAHAMGLIHGDQSNTNPL